MAASAGHTAPKSATQGTRSVHCSAMPTQPEQHRPSSNAFARERDRKVLWLLERHPATAGILVQLGIFPSRKKASKRLARLAKRKYLLFHGTASIKGGGPEQVYGRGFWKADNLAQEVLVCSPKTGAGGMRVSEAPRGQETSHEATCRRGSHHQAPPGRG